MSTAEEKERQQRMEWADMQRRGHFRYAMEQIFSMIGLFAFIQVLSYAVGKAIGKNFPLETMVNTVGFGCIVGFVIAELSWFDMKRKFRIPPPEEDWWLNSGKLCRVPHPWRVFCAMDGIALPPVLPIVFQSHSPSVP